MAINVGLRDGVGRGTVMTRFARASRIEEVMANADPTKGGKYWFCPACGARMFWRHPACLLCETPAPPDIAARAAAAPPIRGFAFFNSKGFEYAGLVVVAFLVIGTFATIRGLRLGLDAPSIALIVGVGVAVYLVWFARSRRRE